MWVNITIIQRPRYVQFTSTDRTSMYFILFLNFQLFTHIMMYKMGLGIFGPGCKIN